MTTESMFVLSEQFIIGAIIKQPKIALTILASQKTTADWFTQPTTSAALQAVLHLAATNKPIEPATILEAIYARNPASTISMDDLFHCEKICSSTSYLLHHVGVIKDRRDRRAIEQILNVGQEKLHAGIETPHIIEELKWMLHGLNEPVKATSVEVIEGILKLYEKSATQGFTGLPSRWMPLQKISGGYPRKGVSVISGLTKHGKTTYICNELIYLARQGHKVLLISLEMGEGEIRAILAGDETDIDLFKLRNGTIRGKERAETMRLFAQCLNAHKLLPMTIVDGSKTIEEIDSLIRGASGEYDLVAIDHLHLIRHGHKEPRSNEERLSFYSNTITNSVVDANVSTMLIAQLSRDGLVDRDGNPIAPAPRHLKYSGSIEQDLTQLIFVYQDPKCGRELVADQAPTICQVALNRIGPVGSVPFVFLKSRQKLIPRVTWEMHQKKEAGEDVPF